MMAKYTRTKVYTRAKVYTRTKLKAPVIIFNPDRTFISNAMAEYIKTGGEITVLPSEKDPVAKEKIYLIDPNLPSVHSQSFPRQGHD